MLKTAISNYQTSLKNSIKSSSSIAWVVATVVVPFVLFGVLLFFENTIATFVMSLFPPSKLQGLAFYKDVVFLVRTEILWAGLFFLLALVVFLYTSNDALSNFLYVRSRRKALYYMMLIACGFFL